MQKTVSGETEAVTDRRAKSEELRAKSGEVS